MKKCQVSLISKNREIGGTSKARYTDFDFDMSFPKRIGFLLVIFIASFVLLHGVVFLVNAIYRQPTWDAFCQEGTLSICQEDNRQLLLDLGDIYQWNIRGSFYLVAAFALLLIPIIRRHQELFAPLLYTFAACSTIFAFFATRGMWFFQIGSRSLDALSSLLLCGICVGLSYLLYKQSERILLGNGPTCPIPEREALLVKPKKR
jgi:hypothetical protein